MNGCKVSIITVSYNSVKTIEQTIQSVLAQTYKNIEYIIIDGASTDGTQQIIEKYKDYLGYYISEKDEGLYYAMNKGIQKATGEIIGIINSDDWYAENAVETVLSCMGKSAAEVVYGKIVHVSKADKRTVSKKIDIENFWYNMAVPHPSVFVRKCIYDRLGKFDTEYSIAADYELMLRFYSEGVKFEYADVVIAYHREGGISAIRQKEKWDDRYKIAMKYMALCPHKDKDTEWAKINETYKFECFRENVSNEKAAFNHLLDKYFRTTVKDIIIFGTGIWGKRCCEILRNNGMEIRYFVDNDAGKQNTELQGIRIIAPDGLKKMDVHVLIAVKECGEEIKSQLLDMGNDKLKCVTIKELSGLLDIT